MMQWALDIFFFLAIFSILPPPSHPWPALDCHWSSVFTDWTLAVDWSSVDLLQLVKNTFFLEHPVVSSDNWPRRHATGGVRTGIP